MTAKLQKTLNLFDLIVGTEEEFHIAGGSTDTVKALRAVRAVSAATLVCKRGPLGRSPSNTPFPQVSTKGRAGRGSRSRSSMFWAPVTASSRGYCALDDG